MPFYWRLGKLPPKRHMAFERPDGNLYIEQLMGREGFSGLASLLYHYHNPTASFKVTPEGEERLEPWIEEVHRHHHLDTSKLEPGGHPIRDRVWLMFNEDVAIGVAAPTESFAENEFYRNGSADEVWFVHSGEGVVKTIMGDLPFRPGDYIIIPQHITWQMVLEGEGPHRFMILESQGQVLPPKRYRNQFGQLLEHAPYSERDFHPPTELNPVLDGKGEYKVVVKVGPKLTGYWFEFHPFDVVGWDGYYFPYTFNITDFEPRVGRYHMPPPTHQHFEGRGYVYCSFCPRPWDFGEKAVPVPYNHANVDSDEVLYYWKGSFMSRPHIREFSFTLHPRGIPHGPVPGIAEKSLSFDWAKGTDEYAPMIDTFRPLKLTVQAKQFDNPDYATHWAGYERERNGG